MENNKQPTKTIQNQIPIAGQPINSVTNQQMDQQVNSTPPTKTKKKLIFILVAVFVVLLGIISFSIILVTKNKKINNSQHVAGDVLVTFNKGITYKQAKELFASLDITEYKNGYYEAMKIDLKDDVIVDKGVFNLKIHQEKKTN